MRYDTRPTHFDLFSGIGGFALAARWAGFRTIGFAETDKYCSAVLKQHWPDVPNFGDVRGVPPIACDLLTGGFPCQPFSCAGKRRGKEDDRYLWPAMLEVITCSRPAWVLGENVPGIIGMALDNVCADLEAAGYEVWPFVIPACAVDARHRRDRLWIVAHANESGPQGRNGGELQEYANKWTVGAGGSSVSNSSQRPSRTGWREPCAGDATGQSWRAGIEGSDGWLPEPDVGGGIDGLSAWLDRIKGLSNEAKTRAGEILRALRGETIQETLQWHTGRFPSISASEVLLALLCELNERTDGRGIAVEGGTITEGILRSVWYHIESARSPHRRQYQQQHTGEYSNALRQLSRYASSCYPEAWASDCWENGVPRVMTKIPNRVDRLRGLGNSIVPKVAYQILKGIRELI